MTDTLAFKDYSHAYTLIKSTNFDAAPKGKFLYHIVFELTEEAKRASTTTLMSNANTTNLQLLSVLAKSVSLPSYTANIETVNQYNRKKKYQTKIEYKDIDISFYDDNKGVSRALLESYLSYYFKESTRNVSDYQTVNPRDKYNSVVGRYGLDNNKTRPFFEYIKIFQLAKKNFFCYTLINPIVSSWSHDDLAYAEGAAIPENKITVGYEAVLYTNGFISDTGDPPNFADIWYDKVKGVDVPGPAASPFNLGTFPPNTQPPNITTRNGVLAEPFFPTQTSPGNLLGYEIPKGNSSPVLPASAVSSSTAQYDSTQLQNIAQQDPVVLDAITTAALGSGKYSPEWGSSNFSEFQNLSEEEQNTIRADVVNKISTDTNIQILAGTVVKNNQAIVQAGLFATGSRRII